MDQYFHQFWATLNDYTFFPIFSFLLLVASASLVTGTLDFLVVPAILLILQARILERVAFPFSRGSSLSRDQTQVSHIAGRFFTNWAIREAQEKLKQTTRALNNGNSEHSLWKQLAYYFYKYKNWPCFFSKELEIIKANFEDLENN